MPLFNTALLACNYMESILLWQHSWWKRVAFLFAFFLIQWHSIHLPFMFDGAAFILTVLESLRQLATIQTSTTGTRINSDSECEWNSSASRSVKYHAASHSRMLNTCTISTRSKEVWFNINRPIIIQQWLAKLGCKMWYRQTTSYQYAGIYSAINYIIMYS